MVGGGGAGGGSIVGSDSVRGLTVDVDFGRDEDEGRELEMIGERVIGDAVIRQEDDDPASNVWDNGLLGSTCFE